jgi:RNA polymerase sigma factor (sigma-70 family)
VEVSALRYSPGSVGLHGKTPLLRLQSDDRLIAFIRRGNHNAFDVLVSRYQSRLLAFCRHLLASKEDAEDVLQEVMTAAFNAILADDRPINVRPWLYRIARNRSLNHLRRATAIGVDSMDIHLSENGTSTADKVHERERFRLLVGDIQELPETQRTALVLREMDALSYEQIAEAMETTVPGVKSLLVRARIALAEAAEARQLSCEDVRIELGEIAEGIRKKPDALARRHLRSCTRCSIFQGQLKKTNKALAALMPIGPLAALKQLALFHIGHSAGTGSASAGTASAGTTAAGTAGATAGATGAGATGVATSAAGASMLGSAGSALSAGAGALAGKAAVGLAAAAIVTAGAVEASHVNHRRISAANPAPVVHAVNQVAASQSGHSDAATATKSKKAAKHHAQEKNAAVAKTAANATPATVASTTKPAIDPTAPPADAVKPADQPGRGQTTTDPTVLTSQPTGSGSDTAGTSGSPDSSSGSGSTASSYPDASSSTGTSGPTGPSDPSSSDPSSSDQSSGDPSGTGSTSPYATTSPTGADPGTGAAPLPYVPPDDSVTGG